MSRRFWNYSVKTNLSPIYLRCFYKENLRVSLENLLTEFLFVIFRLLNMSSSEKIYYEVSKGFLINNILDNKLSEDDRYIFEELSNASQRKIEMYCYGITSQYCWGQDNCYHCIIILIINEEKRKRMGAFPPCEILDQGGRLCRFILANSVELLGKHIINCNFFFLFRKNSIS